MMPTYNVNGSSTYTSALGDSVVIGPTTYSVSSSSTLTLTPVGSGKPGVNGSASHTVTLTPIGDGKPGVNGAASHTITLSSIGDAIISKTGIGTHTISFVSIGGAIRTKDLDASSAITFISVGSETGVLSLSSTTNLAIGSGGYVIGPYVNMGGICKRPSSGLVFFWYPYGAPNYELVFRKPEFGDSYNMNIQTIVRHSRSGEIWAFKRQPVYQILKMEFRNIRHQYLDTIRIFLKASAADYVKFLDHYSQTWKGIIVNNPLETVSETNDGTISNLYNLTIEFEAKRIIGTEVF